MVVTPDFLLTLNNVNAVTASIYYKRKEILCRAQVILVDSGNSLLGDNQQHFGRKICLNKDTLQLTINFIVISYYVFPILGDTS